MPKPVTRRMIHNLQPTPMRPAIAQVYRGCKFKDVFNTEAEAWIVVQSILRSGGDTQPSFPLRPYKCEVCFGWHNGHNTKARPNGK
jgi:hypothetical protein